MRLSQIHVLLVSQLKDHEECDQMLLKDVKTATTRNF